MIKKLIYFCKLYNLLRLIYYKIYIRFLLFFAYLLYLKLNLLGKLRQTFWTKRRRFFPFQHFSQFWSDFERRWLHLACIDYHKYFHSRHRQEFVFEYKSPRVVYTHLELLHLHLCFMIWKFKLHLLHYDMNLKQKIVSMDNRNSSYFEI